MKNSGNKIEKCKQTYIFIDETIQLIEENSKKIVTKKQILIDRNHLGTISASLTRKIKDDEEKKTFNPENLRQIDDLSVDVMGDSENSDSATNAGEELTYQINLL